MLVSRSSQVGFERQDSFAGGWGSSAPLYSPLSHLARSVFPYTDKTRLIFMLSAYFDESGHSRHTDFVSMAGIVAPLQKWERLEIDWKEALKEFELSEWHTSDFAHSLNEYKQYKGKEEKRREMYSRFMNLIRATDGMPMGAIVSMTAWNKMLPAVQKSFLDPYFLCLQDCGHGASVYAIKEPPSHQVMMIFDNNEEFKGRVPKLYEYMQRNFNYGSRLAEEPVFRSALSVVQLQAADIVAYELRQRYDNLLKSPERKPRWGYLELMKIGIGIQDLPWFTYYDEAKLSAMENAVLEDMLQEDKQHRQKMRTKHGKRN